MSFSFKLVSYNVHHGLSTFRKHDVLTDIIDVLKATNADIVCLQEVLREDNISPGALEQACKRVWKNGVYGKTIAFSQTAQGNAIVGRLPIYYHENVKMPSGPWQQRALLRTDILLEGHEKPLIVMCTHLGLTRQQRAEQAQEIITYLESISRKETAFILAGDFNDWQEELTGFFTSALGLKEAFISTTGRHARTYPSFAPWLKLDRIYYRGLKLEQARVVKEAGWRGRPDHLPLLAEFTLEVGG